MYDMAVIRKAEKSIIRSVRICLSRYPNIVEKVPYIPTTRTARGTQLHYYQIRLFDFTIKTICHTPDSIFGDYYADIQSGDTAVPLSSKTARKLHKMLRRTYERTHKGDKKGRNKPQEELNRIANALIAYTKSELPQQGDNDQGTRQMIFFGLEGRAIREIKRYLKYYPYAVTRSKKEDTDQDEVVYEYKVNLYGVVAKVVGSPLYYKEGYCAATIENDGHIVNLSPKASRRLFKMLSKHYSKWSSKDARKPTVDKAVLKDAVKTTNINNNAIEHNSGFRYKNMVEGDKE